MGIDTRSGRGARRTRWWSLVQVGLARIKTKALVTDSRRIALSVSGVAVAIALMLIVTGVALGLSAQTTVGGDSVDYWITPESSSASTMVVSTGGPQFGAVHPTSADLTANEAIRHATPVLMEAMWLETAAADGEYIIVIGVIAHPELEVAGLSAGQLTPGDPYYANGTFNGTWTGEAVVSPAAADLLNASRGSTLVPGRASSMNRTFTVTALGNETASTGLGQLPVVLVHLSEAQHVTGATNGDKADQILVKTNSRGVKTDLEAVYPRSTVLARSGLTAQQLTSGLPLAMGLAALCVAIIVGTLFVGTTMGLEITADQQQYALLGALGLSWRSRAFIVVVQTLTVTLLGGVVGIAIGYLGIAMTNHVAQTYLTAGVIAVSHPVLGAYGLVVAVVIGGLAVPYLLWLTTRTTLLEQLTN